MEQWTDFGWANGWKEKPEIVKKCEELGHKTVNIDHIPWTGLHHEIRCNICRYIYHVDSSG